MVEILDYSQSRSFFGRSFKSYFAGEQWSSQVMAANSSLSQENSKDFENHFYVPSRKVMALGPKEKKLLLHTAYLCYQLDSNYGVILEDLIRLLRQRTSDQSTTLGFQIQLIEERSQQAYEAMLDEFLPGGSLTLIRRWNQTSARYEGKSFLTYALEDILILQWRKLTKRKPRKAHRKKGYRDHGTLASYDSQARKAANVEFERDRELLKVALEDIQRKMPFLDEEDLILNSS